jgi:PKD repeat protein/DNA/RNA endonuclease YhcR with UshA esterase domain
MIIMKIKGGGVFLILGFLFCSGFFIGRDCLASGAVVINEVAWMGTAISANDEWIELRNTSSENINLSGWTLNAADGTPKINLSGLISANGYFLLERTSDHGFPGAAADLIYTGALGNSGENLLLKDGSGNLIDQVDASGGWQAGDNDLRQPMERLPDGSWQTSDTVGGTPKMANGDKVQAEEPSLDNSAEQSQKSDSSGLNNGSSDSFVYRASLGAVLINEFVSYPDASENEWVELYNSSGQEIVLDGWTIVDGSGAATVLSGGFDAGNYFFVKEKFKGALNNSGDEISLYSKQHDLIDQVVYGNYGNDQDNNAPAPGKGESCALKVDGLKALYGKDSYAVTDSPTKNEANIISAPSGQAVTNSVAPADGSDGKIVITEILPNPSAAQGKGEFIELYNNSDKPVDLTGYKIEVEGGRSFEFGKFLNISHLLPAKDYFPFYRFDSNIVLDNNGGTIKFYSPGQSQADQVLNYGAAPVGESYCGTDYLNIKNADNSTKIFLKNSLQLLPWVWSQEPTPGAANLIKSSNHAPHASFSFSDNPLAGVPVNFNASDSFDEDGDQLSYFWEFGFGAGFYSLAPSYTFPQPSNYQVKLTVTDGQASATIQKIIKVGGVISAEDQKNVVISQAAVLPKKTVAAGAKPLVKKIVLAKSSSRPLGKTAVLGVKISAPLKSAGIKINDLKIGTAYKKSGKVMVMPGVFGSQYFYIANAGEAATKIYSYKKNFPIIKIGDLVSVSGVVGGSAEDKYLKIKNSSDIRVVNSGGAILPEKILPVEIVESNLNKLVQADGEIQEKSSNELVLQNGTGTINVYLKNSIGVSAAAFKAGQKISAAGILSKVSGAFAIMPRGKFDLAIVEATSAKPLDSGLVLGAATGSGAWTIPVQENKNGPFAYLMIAGGAVLLFLGGLFIKKYYLNKNKKIISEAEIKK